MNKISLYRKYRPRCFSSVFGQGMIKDLLLASIRSNQIGHAYVFSGPRGIGKTSFAKIFACAINCLNKVNGNDACMKCVNCTSIIDEKAMDVVELDAASYNGVDQIREIILNVNYLPVSLPYKVYIIDEAHMLSNAAWNALLKTIEEPPSYAVFILATTEYQKIPLTIISRCLRLDFKRLNKAELSAMIEYVVDKENISIQKEAITKIVDLADGAGRDALSLLDQLSVHNKIDLKLINQVFGLIDNKYKIQFLEYVANLNFSALRSLVDQLSLEGISFHLLVDDLIQILFDTLTYLQTNSLEYVKKLNENELKTIINYGLDYQRILSLLMLARNKIKDSVHSLVEMEILVYQLTNPVNKLNQSKPTNQLNNELNSKNQLNQFEPKTEPKLQPQQEPKPTKQTDSVIIKQNTQPIPINIEPEIQTPIDLASLFKTNLVYHQQANQPVQKDQQETNTSNEQSNIVIDNEEIIKLAKQALCFTSKQKTLTFLNLFKEIKQQETVAEHKKLVDSLTVLNYTIEVAWVSDNCVVLMSDYGSRVEAINKIAFDDEFIKSFFKVFDTDQFAADKQVIAIDKKIAKEINSKRAQLKNIIINDVNNSHVKKLTSKLKETAEALKQFNLSLEE
ncbi:DNA polymerase III subunit gamma/tau [Ureaplasma diversum]|uniref:DNA polymerase III subunit gamma/tau n=1 Tax=Ureaplasma diversum NCTC 246 TaxID=1188241 RepID=A0A084F1K1_9BACT|nr:DNA polymerase III subunit gamma/tau [Ureaplasma diversum]KEZ24093.1 DNA polymerase III gamma-tau subunit [Ureaplasma diversum NCTC 246]